MFGLFFLFNLADLLILDWLMDAGALHDFHCEVMTATWPRPQCVMPIRAYNTPAQQPE